MKVKNPKSLLIAAAIFIVSVIAIVVARQVSDVQFVGTLWSVIPPIIAIGVALITKEAYSSLFIGIVLGALMATDCSPLGTVDTVITDGVGAAVQDNAGIFVFLVFLGTIVALVNKTGASKAFGHWAQKHVKSKRAAMLATFFLGVLIFIDDYFNCLTVGSVMAPVTDSKRISRVKLAYIIDATAAPICMIAPVSSWAAAVSSYVNSETYSGIALFVRAIPFNFYSLYTLVFVITLAILGFDYGKMAGYEIKAEQEGDLSVQDSVIDQEEQESEEKFEVPDAAEAPSDETFDKAAGLLTNPKAPVKGKVIDLVLTIAVLIVCCIWGLLRNGYQSIGGTGTIIDAFSETDAMVGLPWGGLIALMLVIIYLCARRIVSFKDSMECITKGFIAMVPAMIILTLASSLKNVTALLDIKVFIQTTVSAIGDLNWILPAVIFVIACVIAFATGTSWGTFGILIPIVLGVFPETSQLYFVGISACLAGAVCGDHCSPISDTTIMSSAGARCNHIAHVETQLPYALSVAGISFVTYILAGFLSLVGLVWIAIPMGVLLTVGFLFITRMLVRKKQQTV